MCLFNATHLLVCPKVVTTLRFNKIQSTKKIQTFKDTMLCRLVSIYQCFLGALSSKRWVCMLEQWEYYLSNCGSSSNVWWVPWTAKLRRDDQGSGVQSGREELILYRHRCQNLKFCIHFTYLYTGLYLWHVKNNDPNLQILQGYLHFQMCDWLICIILNENVRNVEII